MATFRIGGPSSLLRAGTGTLRRWVDDGRIGRTVEIPDSRPARPSAPGREARRAG